MSDAKAPGTIGWVDLTVPDAARVRDFYARVAGWTPAPVDMGGYQDFSMQAEGGETVAGVCHARGENAALPPAWLIYITVADLDAAMCAALELGGKVRIPARRLCEGRFCVIEDPAGAVAALFEAAK